MAEPEHIKFILQRIFKKLEKHWREPENEEIFQEHTVEADKIQFLLESSPTTYESDKFFPSTGSINK